MSAPAYDATDSVVGLARTLRAAGVAASPERVQAAVAALALLHPARRDDVYWAGRLTLCAAPDDLPRYNQVFAAYFGERPGSVVRRPRVPRRALRLASGDAAGAEAHCAEALTIARAQDARHWELRAATDLARLWRDRGRRAEAHELLAPVHAWFSDGADAPDLQAASAVLDGLGR